MEVIQMLARAAATWLFRILILVFPIVTAAVILFSSPNFVKDTLKTSGIYDKAVTAVITESAKQPADQAAQAVLNDQGIRDAVAKSITPDVLANTIDQATNGIYGWLQGKTAQPEFRIDLTETKQSLINNLSTYAEQHAASLPTCTMQQAQELQQRGGQNLLTLPCLPPGVNPKQAASQFSNETLEGTEFLNNPVITSNELPKDSQGRPITEQADWAPEAYQWAVRAPLIIGVLAVLAGTTLVFLHTNRRRGVRVIGVSLLVTGVTLLIVVILYMIFTSNLDRLFPNNNGVGMKEVQASLIKALSAVAQEYGKIVGYIAGGYIVSGVATLILSRRKRTAADTLTMPTPPEPDHSQLPTVAPATENHDRPAGTNRGKR